MPTQIAHLLNRSFFDILLGMKKSTAIFSGILSALSATGSVFASARYPALEGSDLKRIRSCSIRVGNDFSKVIVREHGKAANKTI